ncbi:variable surface protein [Plasmodium gonderi]|uniref:Variable surface protein n=1 Tax=Plasmodium gonderi TaxID=77519 RepID=A0A1Y1JNE0_PLAGO|nr:variable surface protein [Plasmodium gonderi]GAW82747.1 variable surface protein [Plasmodium gonderi]
MMTTSDKEKWKEIHFLIRFNYPFNRFLLLHYQEIFLKGSRTHEIYNKFNKDTSNNAIECCKKFEQTQESQNNKKYTLCKKIANGLKILSGIHYSEARIFSCLHYKYWINNAILNFFCTSEELCNASELSMFSKVQECVINATNDNGCEYDFKNLNWNYVKRMNDQKFLNDYFSNYDIIKKNLSNESSNKQEWKDYLNYIIDLCGRYNEQCLHDVDYWDSDCPNYFKRQDEYDPKKLLSHLECEKIQGSQCEKGKMDSTESSNKKIITFYYLKCKNRYEGKPILCELVPATMEYTDDKDESKAIDMKALDLHTTLSNASGGETIRGQSSEGGKQKHDVTSGLQNIDEENYKNLKEADGKTPYLVLSNDGIKWKIHDNETLDCRNYPYNDTYGLCKRLRELRDEGKYKLNPNPNMEQARSVFETSYENTEGGYDSPNAGSHNKDGNEASHFNTSDYFYILLKTMPFRVGVLIILMLGFFFVFFVYYKFTPVGAWVRSKTGVKNKIYHNYNGKKSQYPPRGGKKAKNTSSKGKRIQIAYQNK